MMKKFETISKYYIRNFKKKVFRFPVGGFGSCPNRNPETKEGGCIYCDIKGSGSDLLDYSLNLKEQIEKKLDKNKSYILYFQPYTSTYNEDILIKSIEEGLKYKEFLGVSVGSRPDTISEKLWDFFKKLNEKTYFELEIGLQTSNENTLKFIKRGHSLNDFENAIKRAEKLNLNIIVHIIIGLPGENLDDFLNTIEYLNKFKIKGIKIHPLHIMSSSEISKIYKIKEKLKGGEVFLKENLSELKILTLEEYKKIIYEILKILKEDVILYRITSERRTGDFLGPLWLLEKGKILKEIKEYLKERDILVL